MRNVDTDVGNVVAEEEVEFSTLLDWVKFIYFIHKFGFFM